MRPYGSTRRAGCPPSPVTARRADATASTPRAMSGFAISRTIPRTTDSTCASPRRSSGSPLSSDAWRVQTTGGAFDARAVVIATGFDHDPYMPDWPGRESFSGELIHACAYSDPGPYRGRDVLVVGPGVTGSEVAHLLAKGGAGRVRVACRTPPHIFPRKTFGIPINVPGVVLNHLPLRVADEIIWAFERVIYGNLSRCGLPRPPVGLASLMADKQQAPAYDAGFVASVKAGRHRDRRGRRGIRWGRRAAR